MHVHIRRKWQQLVGRALLNGNRGAIGRQRIDRTPGRSDIKRNVVFARRERQRIRANFIRDVAVRGNAIGTNYDQIDFPIAQQ